MFIISLLAYTLVLLLTFYLIAKVVDDYFVDSLEIITKRLKLSNDVAGATFMAIGSSAPELFTAIIALATVGAEQVGAGTIVGSAIFNILVIVGASALASTAYLNWRPVVRDMGFYIVSILILLFTFRDGQITLAEASVYIIGYLLYLLILANWKKLVPHKDEDNFLENIDETLEKVEEKAKKSTGIWSAFVRIIDRFFDVVFPDLKKKPDSYMATFGISIIFIAIFSWVLVNSAIEMAHLLHISEAIIALTILATGTSIPDLISSLIVARKGRGAMAISNAVGSNTFDILIGLGLPWMVYIAIKGEAVVVGTENLMSSIILLFATVLALLFILFMQRFKIGRKSGYFLIGLYVVYLIYAIYHAIYPESFEITDAVKHLATLIPGMG